jgi:hypothetical protein
MQQQTQARAGGSRVPKKEGMIDPINPRGELAKVALARVG